MHLCSMKKISQILILTSLTITLVGCGDDIDWCDRGASDGYAVGYNKACNIQRSSLIYGEWENKLYAQCYAQGIEDGKQACYRNN